jgi:hypothetical protein
MDDGHNPTILNVQKCVEDRSLRLVTGRLIGEVGRRNTTCNV